MMTTTLFRVAKIALFVVWLAFWGYSATQMVAFSTTTHRELTIPVSLVCLMLWSFTFALSAKDKPFPIKMSVDKKVRPVSKSIQRLRWFLPLVFAGFISLIYEMTILFFQPFKPSWPSPAIPAVITFSPMVYIFALSFAKASQVAEAEINGNQAS